MGRVILAPQRSREWHDERSKILTASKFSDLLTPKTLKFSEAGARRHCRRIATARAFLVYEDEPSSWQMERGSALEPEAREAYTMITGNGVEETSLWIDDKLRAGASPDGLVLDDGLLEIKCPLLNQHMINVENKVMPDEYRLQVQGQLLITGRQWCDFFSYYSEEDSLTGVRKVLPDMLDRVERDEEIIGLLIAALEQFRDMVDEKEQEYRRMR